MKVNIGPCKNNEVRDIEIEIHDYDIWNMDHTLGLIILPMLKMIKESKGGAPNVDQNDVPEELRELEIPPHETGKKHFDRWNYIIDEMIFAFESQNIDWESQFSKGKISIGWKEVPGSNLCEMITNEDHSYEVNWDARNAYQKRISNGFRLFGKYYEGLWT